MNQNRIGLARVYDQYSSLLYGIALQIAPSVPDAESLLLTTFTELSALKLFERDHSPLNLKLIRLMMKIAHARFNPDQNKNHFNLHFFQETPIIQHLICEQTDINHYCVENGLTRSAVMLQLHEEYRLIKKSCDENTAAAITTRRQ